MTFRPFTLALVVGLLGAAPQAQTDFPVRTPLQMPETHGGIFALAVAPDGKSIAGATGIAESTSGGKKSVFGGEILLWDPASGKIRKSLGRHGKTPGWIAYSRDGKSLGSFSQDDGEFKLWDLGTGKLAQTLKLGTGVNAREAAIAFDGKILVTVEEKTIPAGTEGMSFLFPGTLTARDLKTGKTLWKLDDSGVVVMALSTDGKSLLAFVQKQVLEAGKPKITERSVRIWDAQSGKETRTLERGELGYADQIGFLPDGKTIYAVHHGELFRWDAQEGTPLPVVSFKRRESASTLSFSPDGRILGIVYFMGETVEILDLQTNKVLAGLSTKFPDTLSRAAFSGDLRLLVCKRSLEPVVLSVPAPK